MIRGHRLDLKGSHMRAVPLTVTALAAALLLTACDSSGGGDGSHTDSTVCKIGEMGVQVGPANTAPAAGDTGNVPVTLTNRGSKCTLKGFPGIDLYAANKSTNLQPEKGAKSAKLSLAENGTAAFTITYVRGKAGDKASLDVKTIKIGLAGATAEKSFKWSYGPVQGEDSAGVLKASVSAFQQAGD
jgi:hypothetical protein